MGKQVLKSVLAKFVVSLSLILWLINSANMDQTFPLLKSISTSSLFGILLLTLVAWGLAIFRWYLLLPQFSFSKLTEQTFIANFYSLVLPGQIAGEIVKAYRLSKGRSDAEHIAASVLVDKLVGLLGLLAVASVGLITSDTSIPLEVTISIGLCMLFLFIGFFCLKIPLVYLFISSPLRKVAERWPRFGHHVLRIFRLFDAWGNYLIQPIRLFYAFSLGAAFQMICVWIVILFAHELGIDLPFADWCWIIGLVSIAVLLPISIGGIGVREGVFAGTLSLQGVPIEKSIVLSLAVFSISLIGALIGGLLELFRGVTSASVDISKKT